MATAFAFDLNVDRVCGTQRIKFAGLGDYIVGAQQYAQPIYQPSLLIPL